MGSSRSFTMMRVPREAIRRYRLRWALSSLTLIDFMGSFYGQLGQNASELTPHGSVAARELRGVPARTNEKHSTDWLTNKEIALRRDSPSLAMLSTNISAR